MAYLVCVDCETVWLSEVTRALYLSGEPCLACGGQLEEREGDAPPS